MDERVRARAHGRAVLEEVGEQRVRDVLVLERQDVRRGGARGGDEGADRRLVGRDADGRVHDDLGRGRVRGLHEHAQVHAELSGRGGHHACELSSADHGDHWGCHVHPP